MNGRVFCEVKMQLKRSPTSNTNRLTNFLHRNLIYVLSTALRIDNIIKLQLHKHMQVERSGFNNIITNSVQNS
jgi:hypothetical protein